MAEDIFIIEIKARSEQLARVRELLVDRRPDFRGTDVQEDTYFEVGKGRLKLRIGQIESNLIAYERREDSRLKESHVVLHKPGDPETLKRVLVASHHLLGVVRKSREIYFLDNIKFHLDQVEGLGSFVEIEAISRGGSPPRRELEAQVDEYLDLFKIQESSLVSGSYIDLLRL